MADTLLKPETPATGTAPAVKLSWRDKILAKKDELRKSVPTPAKSLAPEEAKPARNHWSSKFSEDEINALKLRMAKDRKMKAPDTDEIEAELGYDEYWKRMNTKPKKVGSYAPWIGIGTKLDRDLQKHYDLNSEYENPEDTAFLKQFLENETDVNSPSNVATRQPSLKAYATKNPEFNSKIREALTDWADDNELPTNPEAIEDLFNELNKAHRRSGINVNDEEEKSDIKSAISDDDYNNIMEYLDGAYNYHIKEVESEEDEKAKDYFTPYKHYEDED